MPEARPALFQIGRQEPAISRAAKFRFLGPFVAIPAR